MKTWLKRALQDHYNTMCALYEEYGTQPFDLSGLVYEDMEYSELDEGFYNYFSYLSKVQLITETERVSLANAVIKLNTASKDPDDMTDREYKVYSKYCAKVFRLQDGVIYADTVEHLYQFTEAPSWEKTIQPWK